MKDIQWYHKLFPFLQPNPIALDEKDYERIIAKGEGREVEKVKSIGKLKIRSEVLMRNYKKFGYK